MRSEDWKFQLDDSVFIEPLSCKGIVLAVLIDHEGVQFHVRYFLNGECKRTYFRSEELQKR